MAIKNIQRNSFGVKINQFDVPDLNAMQISSYNDFWNNKLTDILKEFSPISDIAGGRWKVDLGPEFSLEPDPNQQELEIIKNRGSFTAPLYLNVTVQNLVTKEKKSQRVFVANVPIMTKKGSFIVNGVQKLVVSQLVKSPGVLFSRDTDKHGPVYTAKIIPARGIWIDLTLGSDGILYCRVDRKKKFPATQLIKLFGITKESDIRNYFKDVDVDETISYLDNTLDKDAAFGVEDAVSMIYKKMRPGDIVSVEQGRKYLLSLFESEQRYDFSEVGRHKFDHRLKVTSKPGEDQKYKRTLDIEEIIMVMKELIDMRVKGKDADNIDSLAHRRVRSVGEWIANTFKTGLARVVKNTRDKMTLNEDTNFTPAQLINMKPLAAMIEDFFNTSQLSRFMDQTNLLSEMDQRQFMTCTGPGGLTRERASFDVRDVQPSFYGRICPVNTPEGPAFGLNLHASIYSRVNHLGFLETPYFVVKEDLKLTDPDLVSRVAKEDVTIKGKRIVKSGQLMTKDLIENLKSEDKKATVKVQRFVSKEITWLDSEAEFEHTIAEHINDLDEKGHFEGAAIAARKSGSPVQSTFADTDLMDVSSNQIFSLSTCMTPFVARTDGMRTLMATNQQGQALPLIKPEVPIVATGFEQVAARDSGYVEYSPCDGTVVVSDGSNVVIEDSKTKKKHSFDVIKFLPSNDHSTMNQRVTVKYGEKVKKGDILIEGFGIHDGEFAIGQNVRVAFMSFKGYNYEDAIVLSENLVQKDKFSSTHIFELVCDVHETRVGNEDITKDIPNVSAEKLSKLDNNGVIHIGAYVNSGDILIGKVSPKGEVDLSPEDKLIRVLFGEYSKDVKDSSLYLEHGLSGKVISIRKFTRAEGHQLPNDVLERIHIWLATTRKIKPGDKMAGRHGNKGVVSVVLPAEDMPYTADGKPVDMVLNPLGVVGRMNLGQLLETHLGLACSEKDMLAVTQPLNEIPLSTIQDELEQAGFPRDGKVDLYDGTTGDKFDKPVVVGQLYMNKLHHMVDDKVHTRSTGPYSLVTQQPLGGRSHSGGQRFGEMEVWALEAYGAAYALQEMLTIKSDDVKGRDMAFESIVREKPIMSPNLPSSFIVLANELTALGIKVKAKVTSANDDEDNDASLKVDKKLALSMDQGSLK